MRNNFHRTCVDFPVSNLKGILLDMLNEYVQLLKEKQTVSYGIQIDKCIHYVDQHLYSPLSVTGIAIYMKMNPSYLSSLFKNKTGESLYAYIKRRKIAEAKDMIQNTTQPLTTIASALGFHSLSHFSNSFKSEIGKSPLKYRNG